ncbi:hypothetical protein KR059_005501 [Drosophila kikkawai]|nr:hypothetical protein KR059_005501 [Drosophila kikkawai]
MFRPLTTESNKRHDHSKEEVHANLVIFFLTCALIRFVPIIARKITS